MDVDFSRFCFLPLKYPKLARLYHAQKFAYWVPTEINFNGDRQDWLNLSEDSRKFLKFILAFFAQLDGMIIENINNNLQKETSEFKEAVAFYAMQNAIETIHNETYSLMIDTFIQDIVDREKTLNAIQNFPSIRKIANWMLNWMAPDIPLLERLIAFACVEGVMFQGAFCSIYWFKKQNKLSGLCKANEFIARDEFLHTQFAVELYDHYTNILSKYPKLPEKTVKNIILSAMDVAEEFTSSALQVELVGLNAKDMIQYIRCYADDLCSSLGYSPIYNVSNPFDWMILLGLKNKTNFFEDTVSEYSKIKTQKLEFRIEEDF